MAHLNPQTTPRSRASIAYGIWWSKLHKKNQDRQPGSLNMLRREKREQWKKRYPGPFDDDDNDSVYEVQDWPLPPLPSLAADNNAKSNAREHAQAPTSSSTRASARITNPSPLAPLIIPTVSTSGASAAVGWVASSNGDSSVQNNPICPECKKQKKGKTLCRGGPLYQACKGRSATAAYVVCKGRRLSPEHCQGTVSSNGFIEGKHYEKRDPTKKKPEKKENPRDFPKSDER
ncbi:hypothetical protein BDZ45DRAFT_746100 [Acephala macrosclerotiorum]|nr:hypothetical protein BDZ45DRAFT_746100 [Acephala macrosclerotiorum]